MWIPRHGIVQSGRSVAVTPPLDIYTGAAAAYSLRKLRSAYTGNAVRVRRSSDNAEQDIGFDGSGNLNTSAILSFCGSGNGLVVTWYDQSGNGRNVTQTTVSAQPQIKNASGIIINGANGKPVISFGGSQSLLSSNVALTGDNTMYGIYNRTLDQIHTVFSYGEESSGKRRSIIVWNGGSGTTWYNYASAFAQNVQLATSTITQNVVQYSLFDFTNQQISGNVNNGTITTASRTLTNPASSPIYVGRNGGGEFLTGNIFELILYNSNQSSNNSGILANINSYYSIY